MDKDGDYGLLRHVAQSTTGGKLAKTGVGFSQRRRKSLNKILHFVQNDIA